MHTLAIQLAPVIGAEKSRVPFYIAAGALVIWALVLSFVLGLRKPNFPAGRPGERVVIAVSVVLVIATASAAVLTASTPSKSTSTANSGVAGGQTGGQK